MEELPHIAQVKRLCEVLDKRTAAHKDIAPYLDGNCPLPPAVTEARLTKLYRYLMPVSEAPWGSLIVDSKLDRLEVTGFRDPEDQAAADKIWNEAWQPNWMDSESKLAHGAALLDGRCFASVWADEAGKPDIALDDCTQMAVEYAEGSRRVRTGALRRWIDGDRVKATLWRPDGLYKFQGPERSSDTSTVDWEKREVEGEEWPLPNDLELLPVEIAINRRLKPGRFPYARGEFAHSTGLIDRINLLTFLGLVVAFWMGFPLRGVSGEKIRRRVLVDDAGDPLIDPATGDEKTEALPPFDLRPDSIAQFENPEARIWEFKAADRGNLSIYDELQQLAVITKTPRHYFPMDGGISNIGTETIMAFEGGMHAAVTGHKSTLGDSWEEVGRQAGKILEVDLSQRAETDWAPHEARSLAERADAASKLKDVIPSAAVAELALGASPEQIARWEAMGAANPLAQLVAAAREPTPPVPVGANGNGAG